MQCGMRLKTFSITQKFTDYLRPKIPKVVEFKDGVNKKPRAPNLLAYALLVVTLPSVLPSNLPSGKDDILIMN